MHVRAFSWLIWMSMHVVADKHMNSVVSHATKEKSFGYVVELH